MSNQNESVRMPLTSADVVAERTEALRQLFPEAFTEGKVDFAKLHQALGDLVDDSPERYGLSWAGKSEAIRAVQSLSSGTLLPCKEESVNWDTTENLIIEGDNLEVLRLLQRSYYGKVKMIYIDPPYNTGNDFIYPDDYRDPLGHYLRLTGQVDENGARLATNPETSGRFHSNWLNMMYPRLFLARNLLRDDGVIFVSIDDSEVHDLRCLMNEIFGDENFVVQIAWQSRQSIQNDTDISVNHEHIVVYARLRRVAERRLKLKNADVWHTLPGFAAYPLPLDRTRFSNPDNDPRGDWKPDPFDAPNIRPNLTYQIVNPNTGQRYWPPDGRCWRTDEASYKELLADGRIVFGRSGQAGPLLKVFYEEKKEFGEVEDTWFDGSSYGTVTSGTQVLENLFGGKVPFPFPKPATLVQALLNISTRSSDLVLDFFAGSGTTAHAVLEANRCDGGGNRRFILVQMPEPTGNTEFPTIAEICKERVRRVIKTLNDEDAGKLDIESSPQDRGFKVFRLSSSNFKLWNADTAPKDAAGLAEHLKLFADHVIDGRCQDDILYELLLKSGLLLTPKVEILSVDAKKVYSVNDGVLLICLEDSITQETLRGMIEIKPQAVLCLDHAFSGNDQLKTNTVLEMQSHEIKFQTV